MVAVPLAGCGGKQDTVVVTGKVTYQGQPLHTGSVVFSAKKSGKTRPAIAYIREDGTYEMTTFRPDDGVQPGDYTVAIIAYDEGPLSNAEKWSRLGKKLIPEKYFKHATSGLTATIPDHDVEIDFNLP